ncbi:hypothetical protein BT67DRAFT_371645 [Trichocladium antarcticum]|uniref:Nucleolar protein 16 n=1 Tax=Trichocladium antarcticum TaxID=1450529 RepID=A0AAN6URI5_9PEZI|nr:hypothetical protein BT67DRAFT_371645 [Trichocladium antarcticum]
MGRELQKRKARSSRSTVRMPNRRKKALNPLGSGIIAKNWFKETLSQNYTRFGLVAKLGKTTGGTAAANKSTLDASSLDPLAFQSASHGLLQVGEVRVERDAAGRITRVLRDANPLRDPLNELDSDGEGDGEGEGDDNEEWGGIREGDGSGAGAGDVERPAVVRALEREAGRAVEKTVRKQSVREVEWLRRLVARHGEDVQAMARDVKLNPMQQTSGDIGKRLKRAGLLAA